jgi:dTDP-4-dehydrorhamnose 3,5-epimerase
MDSLGIDGAWVFTPSIHRDNRGSFHEWFRSADLVDQLGYQFRLSQANCSVSRRGVIRGIHFTRVPPGQAKYVVCLSGAILDVVVDIRIGSTTYGRWEQVRLDDETRRAIFISEGLGHGFMALSAHATVAYLCSTPYAPDIEQSVNPLDPAIGIRWPDVGEVILSSKDAAAPTLLEAERAGKLPSYAAAMAYVTQLGSMGGHEELGPVHDQSAGPPEGPVAHQFRYGLTD